MFNIIDLLGIIIVTVGALIAFKKGFVKTFFDFVSTFVAIILAFSLCNLGVQVIKDNTTIDEWLEETLTASLNENNEQLEGNNVENDYIEESLDEPSAGEYIETEENETSNILTETFKNLPQNIQDMVELEEYKETAKVTIIETSIEIILKILSWIVIYLLTRLILMILCFVFNGIMSIPFLKQINNLAGLALGIVLGLFRVYVILAFVSFLTSVVTMDGFIELIKNSMIISVMYENNILISLIF